MAESLRFAIALNHLVYNSEAHIHRDRDVDYT